MEEISMYHMQRVAWETSRHRGGCVPVCDLPMMHARQSRAVHMTAGLENRKLRNRAYARKLVEAGGVSTSMFTKVLGAETTMRFFSEVFFAPDMY